jgi:hypothetical protein
MPHAAVSVAGSGNVRHAVKAQLVTNSHGLQRLSRDNNVQPLRKGRCIKRPNSNDTGQGHVKDDSEDKQPWS